ncbi:hamartin [Pectinophora gossypiella]|uniref:hamartin n=1 Tax=Pectinophora gossypiella TaxID=13191 RepID=UPI00214F1129|nr:hamartin [Pectinophora gossypiella]
MLAASSADEVLALLEGGAGGAREAAELLAALYGAVREPWLVRALLAYHARTGSARALQLLARAPEPHARHLLDALAEQLRAEPAARRAALAALAPLVARRPAWLHRVPPHPLPRDLLRAARVEHEPLPLLHALLALAALLPAAPALAAPHWPELAEALLRPAALAPPPPPAARAHLQLAQLALFHALYATHPVTLLDTLRAELSAAAAREAWERSLQPLLHSVRLHPALVTGSRAREADAARRLEEHDVVAETRRLTLYTPERRDAPPPAPLPAAPAAAPAPGSSAHASRAAAQLRPGAEPWFALVDRCGADSAPHTPLPADADTAAPLETAVEATPENTPAKETRAAFRFPSESTAVRALGLRAASARAASPPRGASPPAGPGAGGAGSGRLARVVAERRAADSPVPFAGGAPPAGALRPEPRAALPAPPADSRPVLQLAPRPAPRRARGPGRPAARPPRRAASAAPAPRSRTTTTAVQTVDAWPEPYEFIIADFYRSLPDDPQKESSGRDPLLPCERLDAYLSELYSGTARPYPSELAEQLALAHAQLMYERWRREAHAERNRRLLGRCRQTRALELQVAALRDRLRATTAERDELGARLLERRASERPQPAAAPAEREARLEQALREESAARARAEAALHEAEAARAQHAAELQRSRGAAFEAARHVEALARAALAADKRAEHVRRLRRELLVLGERDARLAGGARAAAAPAPAADVRALRGAVARAEADAAALAARADAAAARAHELEAALAARDAVLQEMKRATRLAAEEHAARLRALTDKYDALMRVLRAAEGQRLRRLAAEPGPRGPREPLAADGDAAGAGPDADDAVGADR